MNVALDWIKSNVLTVVFLVLMVLALVGLPFLSGRMNATVQDDVTARAQLDGELSRLSKTQIDVPLGANQPPIQDAVLVNDSLVRRLREVTDIRLADAERVQQTALDHNAKGRVLLLPELFPEPDPRQREVLPRQFYDRLSAAYDDLLTEINAGPPPTPEDLGDDIQRRRAQILTSELNKGLGDELTEDESDRLTKELTNARLAYCHEGAGQVGLFVSKDALDLPYFDHTQNYSLTELFYWQWQLWIYEDILRALAEANADSDSVLRASVKRVVWMQLWEDGSEDAGGTAGGGGGGGSAPGGMGFGAGGGHGRRGSGTPAEGQANGEAPAATGLPVAPNPKVATPVDFNTLTGRKTNQLYDVRNVELELIVETAELPEVLDALARQNFISVLNLKMKPVDPHEHLAMGYYYGAGPVSSVTLTLETVWFRQWTAPHMPFALREDKGIKSQTAQAAAPTEG